MKTLFFICGLTSVIVADNNFKAQTVRHNYDSKEENINRIPYLLREDNNGNIYVEDLSLKSKMDFKASIFDIALYLFTANNKLEGNLIKPENFSTLLNSPYFDERNEIIFIIHGWYNNYTSPINIDLTAALLDVYDLNVFVVDWSGPANKFYTTAKSAVPAIGFFLGTFINEMIAIYLISNKSISIIGHSLGAHVAGCTGAAIQTKINYIIGLDPALPLFTLENIDNRLDPTDAEFVQIIHTNGGLLGFRSSIGHADYFPNGGSKQPGCGVDLAGMCSHGRSHQYLTESIYQSQFTAHFCDSFRDYSDGLCFNNQKSFLGGFHIDKEAVGDYYLFTNHEIPFAIEL